MSDFEQDMAQYNDEWTEEELQSPGGSLLPDGTHQVAVKEARCEMSPWDTWQFVLKFGNEKGVITKWQNLDQDIGRKIAMTDARLLGFEGNIGQLQAACESGIFNDLLVEINVKTTPGDTRDFTNIYLNRVLGKAEGNQFVPAAAGDDDIPF